MLKLPIRWWVPNGLENTFVLAGFKPKMFYLDFLRELRYRDGLF